jgi:hypothetical protein
MYKGKAMKNLILLIALFLTSQVFADFSYRIEKWENGDGLSFVIRNEQGQFAGHGTLRLESWNDGDETSEWVARRQDGTLVSGGYKGKLEKFVVRGLEREQTRLVIRNSKGHFVTWVSMDEELTSGFERMDYDRDGKKESVYVVRYRGQFVNWAPARLETWANQEHPVLVVRDTADGSNNGKIMTYVVATELENGRLAYRNPANGQFLSINR